MMQKLKALLSKYEITQGFSLLEETPTGVFSDSRLLEPGSLFVAVKGQSNDGHQFLEQACKLRPLAILINSDQSAPKDFLGVVGKTKDTSKVLSTLAAQFYNLPTEKMFTAGVTGTNGKTSITYLTECILSAAHFKTGVIGTVNHHLGQKVWPSEMTTPDPILLQNRLFEMQNTGANALAIEVSSHALDQFRCDGIDFDVAQFSNLTRDHLDYHQSMENYFSAKLRFFTELLGASTKPKKAAVVNCDDAYGKVIYQKLSSLGVPLLGYAQGRSEIQFEMLSMNFTETRFSVSVSGEAQEFVLPMSGLHNVYNACAAIGAGLVAGLSLEKMAIALKAFVGVPGRLQQVGNPKGLVVFVDYAHSPDALENVLESLQKIKGQSSASKIWTVFGCGGDRDKGKRPQMAGIAERLSDRVMVTSDNPRTEDPDQIINEIFSGFTQKFSTQGSSLFKQTNRRTAIEEVLQKAERGDVILIAGKGHENYQVVGTEKFEFSDVKVVEEFFKQWKN